MKVMRKYDHTYMLGRQKKLEIISSSYFSQNRSSVLL